MQEAEVVKVEDGVNHPMQCNVMQCKSGEEESSDRVEWV